LTLREDEAAALRTLAGTNPEQLEVMLLSAEQFGDPHASDLTVEVRRELLDRLGMYGVRVAMEEIRAGAVTAADLGPKLVDRSGLSELNRVIAEHFLPRARVLQSRTALVALRALAFQLRSTDAARAEYIDREAERIEAGVVDFARIRAAHLVATGSAGVNEADRPELDRLFLATTASDALGLPGGADGAALAAAALPVITRWRERAADPLADPARVEVYETAARTGEAIHATSQEAQQLRADRCDQAVA